MKAKDIIDAYVRIRTIDHTIPDDVLDFMKESSLKELSRLEGIQKANERAIQNTKGLVEWDDLNIKRVECLPKAKWFHDVQYHNARFKDYPFDFKSCGVYPICFEGKTKRVYCFIEIWNNPYGLAWQLFNKGHYCIEDFDSVKKGQCFRMVTMVDNRVNIRLGSKSSYNDTNPPVGTYKTLSKVEVRVKH